MTLAEFVAQGVFQIVDILVAMISYSIGPVPVGAVALVVLSLAIVAYGIDPPVYV